MKQRIKILLSGIILIITIIIIVGIVLFMQKNKSESVECGSEYLYEGIIHSEECQCQGEMLGKKDLFGGSYYNCHGLCGNCQCYEQAKENGELVGEKMSVSCPIKVK